MKIKKDTIRTAGIVLILLIAALILYNQYQIYKISSLIKAPLSSSASGISSISSISGIDIIPKGVPPIYGSELGVSFDDVSPNDQRRADSTIRKLGILDTQINLEGANLDRYIKIATQISCEYCCGADSIIFPNGQAACGCAHSYAMRGLAKYLIEKHGSEYTDDQILEELGKWKVLFFPTIITQKAAVLKQKGIELNYINLASNKYRGIERGASVGGMVGGC